MDTTPYLNISQRVASSLRRMLAEYCPVPGEPAGQADLHAFFKALYDALYASPDSFGLPVSADVAIVREKCKDIPNKSEANKALNKPRKLIADGLDFLFNVGLAGRLEDGALAFDPGCSASAAAFLKKKAGRAWAAGLAGVGLALAEAGETTRLSSSRFPLMMPALKAMAQSCAACPDANLGRVFFARCDLRALRADFSLDALDLFRVLPPADRARAADLHAYFTARGYKVLPRMSRTFDWLVQYQGKKSMKSTPLFQVQFDERYLNQMRAQIKCASSARIIPLLPAQSTALQADFATRAINCGGCDWCRNSKTLGPSEYEYNGESRKVCWYSYPEFDDFNDQAVRLVKEYAELHELLAE